MASAPPPAAVREPLLPSAAAREAGAKLAPSLPTDAFVAFLEWRSSRAKVLRQVPLSLLMYVLFAVGIVLRARVGASYSFESNLVASVVKADNTTFAVGSIGGWYSWVNKTLIQGVLPWVGPDGRPLPPSDCGRLANGAGLIIGGVRLVQTRWAPGPCPLDPPALATLYGRPCYGDPVTTGYGFGNLTAAVAAGVDSAFRPTTVAGDEGEGAEYQLFLDPEEGQDALVRYVTGLRDAGWLDGGTASAGVQIALLNGNVGLFGRVELRADFAPGGAVAVTTSVQSTPVDPYYGPAGSWTVFFDIVLWGYWLYLFAGTLRRFGKTLRRRSVQARSATTAGRVLRVLLNYWRFIDIATTVTLLVTLGTWYSAVAQLARIRAQIADAHPTGPSSFAGGPSPLAGNLFDAHAAFWSFKSTAVVTITLLTLRLFKYFKYQPRLAVLSSAIAGGLSDFLHVSLLFGMVLAGYGIVGHFAFGNQAPDWKDVRSSMVAVLKLTVYVSDLPSMQAAFPGMADAFFTTFTIIVTNAFLWIAFASVFSAYDAARIAARKKSPSAFRDFGVYIASVPGDVYAAWLWPAAMAGARLLRVELAAARYLPPPTAVGIGSVAPEVLKAVRAGALSVLPHRKPGGPDGGGGTYVTSALLTSVLRLPPATAVALMTEAVAFVRAAQSSAARAAAEEGGWKGVLVEPSGSGALLHAGKGGGGYGAATQQQPASSASAWAATGRAAGAERTAVGDGDTTDGGETDGETDVRDGAFHVVVGGLRGGPSSASAAYYSGLARAGGARDVDEDDDGDGLGRGGESDGSDSEDEVMRYPGYQAAALAASRAKAASVASALSRQASVTLLRRSSSGGLDPPPSSSESIASAAASAVAPELSALRTAVAELSAQLAAQSRLLAGLQQQQQQQRQPAPAEGGAGAAASSDKAWDGLS